MLVGCVSADERQGTALVNIDSKHSKSRAFEPMYVNLLSDAIGVVAQITQ